MVAGLAGNSVFSHVLLLEGAMARGEKLLVVIRQQRLRVVVGDSLEEQLLVILDLLPGENDLSLDPLLLDLEVPMCELSVGLFPHCPLL